MRLGAILGIGLLVASAHAQPIDVTGKCTAVRIREAFDRKIVPDVVGCPADATVPLLREFYRDVEVRPGDHPRNAAIEGVTRLRIGLLVMVSVPAPAQTQQRPKGNTNADVEPTRDNGANFWNLLGQVAKQIAQSQPKPETTEPPQNTDTGTAPQGTTPQDPSATAGPAAGNTPAVIAAEPAPSKPPVKKPRPPVGQQKPSPVSQTTDVPTPSANPARAGAADQKPSPPADQNSTVTHNTHAPPPHRNASAGNTVKAGDVARPPANDNTLLYFVLGVVMIGGGAAAAAALRARSNPPHIHVPPTARCSFRCGAPQLSVTGSLIVEPRLTIGLEFRPGAAEASPIVVLQERQAA
ncbi:MAG: hypothetical protein JOZ13_14925 [Alphaproteobacteria bacterium]|nr:hypothetical protein [Alphaproteobacteria bacterium]